MRQFPHAQVVDDQQWDGRQVGEDGLAGAIQRRVGQFLEQRMRFAIRDTVALLDRGAADRLGQMAFAGARRAEEEGVFTLADEARAVEERQKKAWARADVPIASSCLCVKPAKQ